jgi:hypothetical protein
VPSGRARAAQAYGGDLLVNGCEFQASGKRQIYIGPGVSKAIVTNNLIAGTANITNAGAKVAVIQANAADSGPC